MQKSILLFLCAVSGTLLAGCYENDSSGPDMVDPWLRERTPLGFRVESQVGEAVITDDWRHDETRYDPFPTGHGRNSRHD